MNEAPMQQLKTCPDCSTQTTAQLCPKCKFPVRDWADYNNQPQRQQLDAILKLAAIETDPANRRTLIFATRKILETL